ncbi:MAG: DnaJ domain-containing protein [Vicinamibacterales bacterium]
MSNYYELLDVPSTASADEIKHAFRREIARYHPDKVHHLGKEFQEIAATKAAELTQAHLTLNDAELRAAYDAQLEAGVEPEAAPIDSPAPASTPATSRITVSPDSTEPESPESGPTPGSASTFSRERTVATEVVRRAAINRLRHAVNGAVETFEEPPMEGFEVVCVPTKSFWALKSLPRLVGRFVPFVDVAAVREAFALARRAPKDSRDVCIFLLGAVTAPATELAEAIAEQRRKPTPSGGKLTLIFVDTRTWKARVPEDAPPIVASLLAKLTSA